MTDIPQIPLQDPALLDDNRDVLEAGVREAAKDLAHLEEVLTEEFLLAVIAKTNSFQAQKQAEHKWGTKVRLAQAEYEIALARLRKG